MKNLKKVYLSSIIKTYLGCISVVANSNQKDPEFCSLNNNIGCKEQSKMTMNSKTKETTLAVGWQIPILVVNSKESAILDSFLNLDPPPLIKLDNKNFFQDGVLFKIPGLPKELDQISHLSRGDPSSDANFYANPRLVTHIDDFAIESLTQFYRENLKEGFALLDLCSSWISHLPEEMHFSKVMGIGMNQAELEANGRLSEFEIHDLNSKPDLSKIESDSLDAVLITVSVDYLVKPLPIFSEVYRVLKPSGGKFIVSFSNRFFPTKVIQAWGYTRDPIHLYIVAFYFQQSAKWDRVLIHDVTKKMPGLKNDPMYVLEGIK